MTLNNRNNDSWHSIGSVCMPSVLPLVPFLLSFVYSTNTQSRAIGLERESGIITDQHSKKGKLSSDCKNLPCHSSGWENIYKVRCKINRKHYFSQGHATTVMPQRTPIMSDYGSLSY